MSLSLTPPEIKCEIANFIQPTKMTNGEVKSCARTIVNLSLTCKKFKEIFAEKLEDLKKINALIEKYSKYNDDYEPEKIPLFVSDDMEKKFPGGNPQLLDALFTGYDYAKHSFSAYTPKIEEDIKQIVKLTPQSLNCILGVLRCRDYLPPLAAACWNKNIPVHMVEFLLKKGLIQTRLIKSVENRRISLKI